ncbi:virulence RhuM family protein [Patescibacteria group bacterium]|nr:virulence RhuM family protein [Patescibacteria group bacterium]MBU4481387.1 virulence RhuM family protein [Patescibacteria group bacterium]
MAKNYLSKGEIVIYKSSQGPEIQVKLEKDTVWLTQKQMAILFEKRIPTINEHIKNIFKKGELEGNSVIRKFRITAADGKTYGTQFYNLDVIISVGYRVKSHRGTQFRIWATKTLKNHLVEGYTINENRLLAAKEKLRELQNAITFLQEKSKHKLLTGQEREILNLLANYSKTLTLLDQYDKEKLPLVKKAKGKFVLEYSQAKRVVQSIKKNLLAKKEASDLFGQEIGEKFQAALGSIYQTFDRKEVYSSLEEKAAHFLYFVIKDHPFVDGNKRIGSFLFVYFLDRNNELYRKNGEKKINDNALTALALLIATSDPKEKDVLIKIISNLISN